MITRTRSLFAGLCLVAACERSRPPAPATEPPALAHEDAARAPGPASWTGRWIGPEGTFLEIVPDGEHYQVTVANLDGPRTFEGVMDGTALVFERDGVREVIRAGTGPDTGMKWLTGKTRCLVVKPGEGYCRD